jgi:hypothetical protein
LKETKEELKEVKTKIKDETVKGGSSMGEIVKNAAKLVGDVVIIGGITVLTGALGLYVKNKSKDTWNEGVRQKKEITRIIKEKL